MYAFKFKNHVNDFVFKTSLVYNNTQLVSQNISHLTLGCIKTAAVRMI